MPEEAEQEGHFRSNTNAGRPCGNETFIKRLDATLSRRFTPRKAGRNPNRCLRRAAAGLILMKSVCALFLYSHVLQAVDYLPTRRRANTATTVKEVHREGRKCRAC